MNYIKIYNDLINKVKLETRCKNEGLYFEKHHILPKCLGGTNEKNNLILLTAKEHFICHKLLMYIYPDNWRLVYAFWMLTQIKSKNQERNFIISSREYENIKIMFSLASSEKMKNFKHSEESKRKISENNKGKKHSEESKKRISDSNKGKIISEETIRRIKISMSGYTHSEETKQKISKSQKGKIIPESEIIKNSIWHKEYYKVKENHPMFGKHHSEESKNLIKISKLGKKQTEKSNKKRSDTLKGRIFEKTICPHCNKEGAQHLMKRYHFDNCKIKNK